MFNFLFGYFLGSSGGKHEGSDSGGGLFTFILSIIILIVLGTLIYFGYTFVISDSIWLTYIKYLLYPSMWDVYHNVGNGHAGVKAWIMVINFFTTCFASILVGLPILMATMIKRLGNLGFNIFFLLASIIAFPNVILVIFRFIYFTFKVIF